MPHDHGVVSALQANLGVCWGHPATSLLRRKAYIYLFIYL